MLSIGPDVSTKRLGLISGFLLGVFFAFGSMPRTSPIFAAVLAIPFLFIAPGIRQFLGSTKIFDNLSIVWSCSEEAYWCHLEFVFFSTG